MAVSPFLGLNTASALNSARVCRKEFDSDRSHRPQFLVLHVYLNLSHLHDKNASFCTLNVLCLYLVANRRMTYLFVNLFLTWFGPSESIQTVCAGVSGQIQCWEDALSYPTQALSQWTWKGVYRLKFSFISFVICVVTLTLRPRCLCPQVVTPLVWKPDTETSVPLWIIILAILAGLLLLALLIYVLYKVSETNGDMSQIFTFKTTCKRNLFCFFVVWIL